MERPWNLKLNTTGIWIVVKLILGTVFLSINIRSTSLISMKIGKISASRFFLIVSKELITHKNNLLQVNIMNIFKSFTVPSSYYLSL